MTKCAQILFLRKIEGFITKASRKKLRVHLRIHEWAHDGGVIMKYRPIIFYTLFKSTNPSARIGFFNLKSKIDKSALVRFGISVQGILDNMSSNYTIVIDEGEQHEYYVHYLFRDLFFGSNSTFNCFV